jgi:hypothetical protein
MKDSFLYSIDGKISKNKLQTEHDYLELSHKNNYLSIIGNRLAPNFVGLGDDKLYNKSVKKLTAIRDKYQEEAKLCAQGMGVGEKTQEFIQDAMAYHEVRFEEKPNHIMMQVIKNVAYEFDANVTKLDSSDKGNAMKLTKLKIESDYMIDYLSRGMKMDKDIHVNIHHEVENIFNKQIKNYHEVHEEHQQSLSMTRGMKLKI